MVKALTTGTTLRVVREVHEDESGAMLRFQQGGQGRLVLGDANYATHLRLARRGQERQHPVGITFGEGQEIAEVIRADNDVPSELWEEEPGQARVLFQGHDGVFRIRPEHPESARLRAELSEAMRQKARVWFIAQKLDLAVLDVLPAGRVSAATLTCNGGGSTAAFRFVGGPLDGLSFDPAQVNAVARVMPVVTDSGNRQFLLMPPGDECERVLRGEVTKDQVQGPLHPYERRFTASGAVEYRNAGDGGFESALQQRDQPLSEQARARKRTFGELADQFIERIQSTNLLGGTEVTIRYHCVDEQGTAFPPIRTSITPRTTVRFPGHQAEARVFAAAMHLDSIIGNINSLVRNAPTGYVSFPGYPERAVQIRGIELEIEHPAEQGGA